MRHNSMVWGGGALVQLPVGILFLLKLIHVHADTIVIKMCQLLLMFTVRTVCCILCVPVHVSVVPCCFDSNRVKSRQL